METLVLFGGFIWVFAAGLWVMGKIDRFLSGGGIRPYWDEDEEQRTPELPKDARAEKLGGPGLKE